MAADAEESEEEAPAKRQKGNKGSAKGKGKRKSSAKGKSSGKGKASNSKAKGKVSANTNSGVLCFLRRGIHKGKLCTPVSPPLMHYSTTQALSIAPRMPQTICLGAYLVLTAEPDAQSAQNLAAAASFRPLTVDLYKPNAHGKAKAEEELEDRTSTAICAPSWAMAHSHQRP